MFFKARQTGNALFLILIAVALFAALSYAVTQSGRGGGSIDRELALLASSQTAEYGAQVGQAVVKLLLLGCAENEISFWNDSDGNGTEDGSDDYFNSSSPADRTCHVFDPAGGGVTPQTPSTQINDGSDWFFSGGVQVHDVGNTNFDAASQDLTMLLFNIDPEVCQSFNDGLGLGLSSVPIDGSNLTLSNFFTGTFALDENINGIPGASSPSPCPGGLCGEREGCFREENAGERYVIYKVLIAR